MAKKINVTGKPARRIEVTGKPQRRIEPEEFAAAIGAEYKMKKPWLVQRGKLRKHQDFQGIDSLVNFDYMGSSEFEYGALPKALKTICGMLAKLQYCETDIKYKDKSLWLLCRAEDEAPLKEFFTKIAADRFDTSVRTLELLHYGKQIGEDGTDFWWDLENNWIAAFGQDEIEDVSLALELVKQKKDW